MQTFIQHHNSTEQYQNIQTANSHFNHFFFFSLTEEPKFFTDSKQFDLCLPYEYVLSDVLPKLHYTSKPILERSKHLC